jgi:type IV pilus assembly protein PilW
MKNKINMSLEKGFTIVELMIAMALGLVLAGAVITVFVDSRHSFDREDNIQRMQDDARQAVRELSNDIGMAGFWADMVLPTAIINDASLAIGTDCGPAAIPDWMYQAVNPGTNVSLAVTSVDNAIGATASANFSCIDPAELQPGTDVIGVKRLAGAQAAAVTAGTVYLRTNGTVGLLYREPEAAAGAAAVPAPFTEWEYRPSIYYVRNFAITAGDQIPTLCRKVMQFGAPPTMVTECLAQGIENLQIEYGLDTSGNGEPNIYVPNPTLAQLQTAVTARIDVLARSTEDDLRYTNGKTYTISNSPVFAPADNFYRRVYSITVGLHNLHFLRVLRS